MKWLAAYGEPVEGTPFGRYRLIALLGRGGMGEVWRAHDTSTNRIVAIKLLPPHLAQDDTFVKRFRREAEAAARLNNPHIIPIHTYGEIDGRLYVDMRLIEGRDLQEVLADGPLELGRAVRITEQVAKALHAAHKVGLVHRDVKPSNILLDEDDFAYLIDFGLARGADQTRMTSTGGVIGSWPYMAPERFSAQEADARADVYALACVLYECLTGHTPYPGDSLEQQYAGHVATPPPQPSSTNPDLPADFDRVTEKGLAKDPDQRYATTIELANAAHDALTAPEQDDADTILANTQAARRPDQATVKPPASPTPKGRPAGKAQTKSRGHLAKPPTSISQQRRALAKREVGEQLERRAAQASVRRGWTIGLSAVLAVTVAAVIVGIVVTAKNSGTEIDRPKHGHVDRPGSRRIPGGAAVAIVHARSRPGRQLPVPAFGGPGQQAGEPAEARPGAHRPGAGQRQHGH